MLIMFNRNFVVGVVVGVAGVYVWNRYVRNIPSKASA